MTKVCPQCSLPNPPEAAFCHNCASPLSSPGAILGWLELQAIKDGRASADGKMMSQVGLWVGIGATVIHIGLWALWLLFTALAGGGAGF